MDQALRFFGDQLIPDEVTRIIGKTPTVAAAKGEIIKNPKTGRERTARKGSWRLHVERRSPGDFDTQIAELLAGTSNDFTAWQKLSQQYDGDIFCGLFMLEENEGVRFSPETLQHIGERGLILHLDIYHDSEEKN
ncbi:DUF4279 domain-containing protein [Parvularcula sp. IMCC14364]|uniref:DUF4279 domain-containing protein n=1 Tax=Parvularcula sp. IMCC14364 TaxID=3067902 RepID=UPI0027424578|nr:DUF4279 domain-containing protein [Parvularcula sp. IMCC14364]